HPAPDWLAAKPSPALRDRERLDVLEGHRTQVGQLTGHRAYLPRVSRRAYRHAACTLSLHEKAHLDRACRDVDRGRRGPRGAPARRSVAPRLEGAAARDAGLGTAPHRKAAETADRAPRPRRTRVTKEIAMDPNQLPPGE